MSQTSFSEEKINQMIEFYIHAKFDIEDEIKKILKIVYSNQFVNAVKLFVSTNDCTTANLQRKLNIGYGKAASIIDAMEALGLVTLYRVKEDDTLPEPRQTLPAAGEFLLYKNG